MLTKGQLERELLGLSVKELANRCGLAESYVTAILRGRVRPSKEALVRLSKALGISPEEVQTPGQGFGRTNRSLKNKTRCKTP